MNNITNSNWPDFTEVGLYTVPMAARLISADKRKLRSWIDGYPHSGAEPIIHRQLPRIGGRTALGFLDLIEVRFVRHFLQWFSPQTIRRVAVKLRERHNVEHPFATNNRFRTDGKAIFMESTDDENERRLLNLMNDNFEMEQVIEQSLFHTIFYVNDLAHRWLPNRETPRVIIDPKIAFGRPVIQDAWVPTEILYSAFKIEGGTAEAAEEFGVDEDAVMQAIKFEQELDSRVIH